MKVHPSQITPGEAFSIFYFIRNHLDSATYYVRAVVYDVNTGEVLETKNLTSSSAEPRLFLASITAPADPTGYGREIVAIATVYTDAGYTLKSENYEEQEHSYLVRDTIPFAGGGGGIDPDLIRDILTQELDKRDKTRKDPPPLPEMPWESLFGSIGKLQETLNRLPKEGYDDKALANSIDELKASVQNVGTFEKTDLSGMEDALFQIATQLRTLEDTIKTIGRSTLEEQKQQLAAIGEQVVAQVGTAMQEYLATQQVTIPFNEIFQSAQKKPARQEASPADIAHLLSV